jgi:DNA-binding MarR family transcriptional regulator
VALRDSIDAHIELWSKELEWMDPVQEAILGRLAIIARRMGQNRRDTLATGGLSHGEFKVLLTLRRLGPPYATSPTGLADQLGLTKGALSARLGPLEQAGLLTRTNDAADRRRVEVRLTRAGHTAFDRHARGEAEREASMLAPLSPAEQGTLSRLLRKVVHAIETVP